MKSWEYEQAIIDTSKNENGFRHIFFLTAEEQFEVIRNQLEKAGSKFSDQPPFEICGVYEENDIEMMVQISLAPHSYPKKIRLTGSRIRMTSQEHSWINHVNLYRYSEKENALATGMYKSPQWRSIIDYNPSESYIKYLTRRIDEGADKFRPARFEQLLRAGS